MEQKASIHVTPRKAFEVAVSDENERRGKDKEWYERGIDYRGAKCHYDWWRRKLNFEIVKGKILPQLSQPVPMHERLQERLQKLGFKNYKADAKNAPNIVMDFVIGGSQEKMREMAFGDQQIDFEKPDKKHSSVKRMDDIEKWAMDTYRWAAKKYGEENIIGFNVHLDEWNPHIHMLVVPVAERKKRGRVKDGEERKTTKTVSYYGVVGDSDKERHHYFEDLHTDYHLQVGYKYGLERGTFFDDLSPEEQEARGHLEKRDYQLRKRIEEKKKNIEKLEIREKNTLNRLDVLDEEVSKTEKKLKSFRTMITNLEAQQRQLEENISSLQQEYNDGKISIEELARQMKEMEDQKNEVAAKLTDKRSKLNEATKRLDTLADTYKTFKEGVEEDFDEYDRRLEVMNKELQRRYEEIKATDAASVIAMTRKHAEKREEILYRRWPGAKEAVDAIVARTTNTRAKEFTPIQAVAVENAIASSGIDRREAAHDLMDLADKEFDERRTSFAWIKQTAEEVTQIADFSHVFSAFLQQQAVGGGGGGNNDLPKKKDDERFTGYEAMRTKGKRY